MKKQYNFRLEEELIKQLEKIAEEEERSTAQEITYLIKKEIQRRAKENPGR